MVNARCLKEVELGKAGDSDKQLRSPFCSVIDLRTRQISRKARVRDGTVHTSREPIWLASFTALTWMLPLRLLATSACQSAPHLRLH